MIGPPDLSRAYDDDFRRLQYFVKIVDIGSLTQAAEILHVAQPALSQQLATLEGEVQQQLLTRTKRGVVPTEAGRILYRHAQVILRQCEQARADINAAGRSITGAVSLGLAPERPRRRWRCRCSAPSESGCRASCSISMRPTA